MCGVVGAVMAVIPWDYHSAGWLVCRRGLLRQPLQTRTRPIFIRSCNASSGCLPSSQFWRLENADCSLKSADDHCASQFFKIAVDQSPLAGSVPAPVWTNLSRLLPAWRITEHLIWRLSSRRVGPVKQCRTLRRACIVWRFKRFVLPNRPYGLPWAIPVHAAEPRFTSKYQTVALGNDKGQGTSVKSYAGRNEPLRR